MLQSPSVTPTVETPNAITITVNEKEVVDIDGPTESIVENKENAKTKNLWNEICQEYQLKYDGWDTENKTLLAEKLDAWDELSNEELKQEINSHNQIDLKKCTPRQFLETFVFPTLLPALEAMLRQAKLERCFERKRTKFCALDFLTEYLYTQNPRQSNRETKDLWDIPFVIEWLKIHPRQPLPLSLVWTEVEAATVIQSFWRGHKVRMDPEVQELRQWQREWRYHNGSITHTVEKFWNRKMSLVKLKKLSIPSEVDSVTSTEST